MRKLSLPVFFIVFILASATGILLTLNFQLGWGILGALVVLALTLRVSWRLLAVGALLLVFYSTVLSFFDQYQGLSKDFLLYSFAIATAATSQLLMEKKGDFGEALSLSGFNKDTIKQQQETAIVRLKPSNLDKTSITNPSVYRSDNSPNDSLDSPLKSDQSDQDLKRVRYLDASELAIFHNIIKKIQPTPTLSFNISEQKRSLKLTLTKAIVDRQEVMISYPQAIVTQTQESLSARLSQTVVPTKQLIQNLLGQIESLPPLVPRVSHLNTKDESQNLSNEALLGHKITTPLPEEAQPARKIQPRIENHVLGLPINFVKKAHRESRRELQQLKDALASKLEVALDKTFSSLASMPLPANATFASTGDLYRRLPLEAENRSTKLNQIGKNSSSLVIRDNKKVAEKSLVWINEAP